MEHCSTVIVGTKLHDVGFAWAGFALYVKSVQNIEL